MAIMTKQVDALFRGELDLTGEPVLHCPNCNLGIKGYDAVVEHVERQHRGEAKQFDGQLVILAIENGLCDAYLQQIVDKAMARRDVVSTRKAINLDRGDKFTIINISPKLLAGVEVEFIRHDGQWLEVEIVGWTGSSKYPRGRKVKLRHSHVGTVTFRTSGTNL